MADFETFDAERVEEIAAEGAWVIVVMLDESDASRDWEEMLENERLGKCFEPYETFLMRLESAPQQTSEAMEHWEVDQLPAMLVVAPDGTALNDTCLTADSVDEVEDMIQFVEDQTSYLSGEEDFD